MADGPNIWNIGDDIVLEIFIADPTTGYGLTGQDSYADITIRRDSDSRYWTGSTWVDARTTLSPTEADSANQPGRYIYALPGIAGNIQADRYVMHVSVDNPPTVEGDSYEAHVSREQDVKIYEAEPA